METLNNVLSSEDSSHSVSGVEGAVWQKFDREEGHIADDYQLALATQRVI